MTIKINNFDFDVKFVERNDGNLLAEDGFYRHGITNLTDRIIYIRNDFRDKPLERVLLHELTHAFAFSYGFEQIEWNEEVVADFIGIYMRDIIKTYNNIVDQPKICK